MARDGLDKARFLGVIAQCRANLIDGEIDAALEINKGVRIPDMFANLVARHHLSSVFHEHEKDREMLTLQSYRVTTLV